MSEKLAEQLAEQVATKVIKSGVRTDILDALENAVRNNVRDAMLPTLLIYGSNVARERDVEWVRQLADIWGFRPDDLPTNPVELEERILGWQALREMKIRKDVHEQSYGDGWRAGLEKAGKLAWGAAAAGKSLDEVMKKLETLKPE